MSLYVSKMVTSLVIATILYISLQDFSPVSAMRLNKKMSHSHERLNKCNVVFDKEHQKKWKSAVDKCFKSDTTEKPDMKLYKAKHNISQSLEDFDAEDKCKNKCMYKELGFLTEDSNIKEDDLPARGGNLTETMKAATKAIWKTCIDDSGKIAEKKSFPSDNCNLISLHNFCVRKSMFEQQVFEKCD